MQFQTRHPHFEHLRKKWTSKSKSASDNFINKHDDSLRRFTLGGLGGLMLLTSSGLSGPSLGHSVIASGQSLSPDGHNITKGEDKNIALAQEINKLLPQEVKKLSSEEDEKISQLLSTQFQVAVKPEMSGIRLNRTYGVIGGEQHLYRYPGDTLYKHAENAADWAMYGSSGIAPGLGAWGYFSPSEASFSDIDRDRERYYLAVQTFLAPGFAENTAKYRDFFKFRKMLVVNPKTGQSVVAVVGDAGPAEWTGKHLGGSPEVMHYLGLAGGPRKGPVLYYFIDDPEDKIPLGPIKVKE